VTGDTTPTSLEDQGGDGTDDNPSGDDETSTTVPGQDDNSLNAAVARDVSSRGRFRAVLALPDDAVRGSHSLNIDGTDRDGLETSCALIVSVLEPTSSSSNSSPTTEEGGTSGTTGTTEGSTPTTGSTTTSTSP